MKSFKQFISESVNISGDFTGNIYINSDQKNEDISEKYLADVMWQGSLHRFSMLTKTGIPSKPELCEMLQKDYPGAVVHNIYPVEDNNPNIEKVQRYHPAKLQWID